MTQAEPVVVTTETLRGWPLPDPGSDKESRGRVLVLGGGDQTPGAALLAGEAALRAGGGKLQIATSRGVAAGVGAAAPEARVIPLPEIGEGGLAPAAAEPFLQAAGSADVVLLGPGLMDVGAVVDLLTEVVPHLDSMVVLDALATAYVTEHPDGLRHLAGRCVITANPDEVSHMLGREADEVTADQLEAAADLARRTGAVVLCGAAEKTIVTPDGDAWLVQAGGPGLGISGSGDVQAGLVAGLLGRGAQPAQAAVWGAYVHGRAGERLATSVGPLGFLARELPAQAPAVLGELTG